MAPGRLLLIIWLLLRPCILFLYSFSSLIPLPGPLRFSGSFHITVIPLPCFESLDSAVYDRQLVRLLYSKRVQSREIQRRVSSARLQNALQPPSVCVCVRFHLVSFFAFSFSLFFLFTFSFFLFCV